MFTNIVGYETATKYKMTMYIASSSLAEMIADVFLCPFEATKLKM